MDRDRLAQLARICWTQELAAHMTTVWGIYFYTPRRDDLARMIARAALERLHAERVQELDART